MNSSLQEQILVVQKSQLFASIIPWQGIDINHIESVLSMIIAHQEYMLRSDAETNHNYKQIIPYAIFNYDNKYFIMERKSTASEQRLAGKLSLGIGGHMRQEDMQGQTIFDWAAREFNEEVSYQGNLQITTLGIVNDDSSEVGKVHLGIVLLLQGDNDKISIKDEHKSGQLLTRAECLQSIDQFENWSKIALQILPE